jgi:general secretion pathway protein B
MSSILKALKKLEDDKATRHPGELRIDAEILRTDSHSRFSSSGLLVTSLFLVALGSGATYMYMKRNIITEQTSQNLRTLPLPLQNTSPVSRPHEITPDQLPPEIVIAPAQQHIIPRGEHQKKSSSQRAETSVVVPKRAAVPLTAAPPPLPVASSVKQAPALRVNGIAFQEGSSGSVAMINGEPLSNGSVVGGAKVEEIFKNKVKFSYNGDTFEILLGQSNR